MFDIDMIFYVGVIYASVRTVATFILKQVAATIYASVKTCRKASFALFDLVET